MLFFSLTLSLLYLTSANRICDQKPERRLCTKYSLRWFFDSDAQSCKRFWYGGCEAKENNFEDKDQCENTCLKTDVSEVPQGQHERDTCKNSVFGCCADGVTRSKGENKEGCLETAQPEPITENKEDVDTETEDDETEALEEAKPEVTTEVKEESNQQNTEDICKLSKDKGTCNNYTIKWHFDSKDSMCKRFWYTGCAGNGNRFSEKQECENACIKRDPQNEKHQEKMSCENSEFGCCADGITYATGENKRGCPETAQPEPITDNKKEDPGTATEQDKTKDSESAKPEMKEEVKEEDILLNSQDICSLTRDRGQCSNFTITWYYDFNEGVCKRFWYSGCGGNDNRFSDRQKCEDACVNKIVESTKLENEDGGEEKKETKVEDNPVIEVETKVEDNPVIEEETKWETTDDNTDICKLPKDIGPCRTATRRWYFNNDSGKCEMFTFGGCDGNENNFKSPADCKKKCDPDSYVEEKTEVENKDTEEGKEETKKEDETVTEEETKEGEKTDDNIDVCQLPKDIGPCRTATRRWYFNNDSGKCEMFTFGGCDGNENNFESVVECMRKCDPDSYVVEETKEEEKNIVDTTDVETDICQLPSDVGPCRKATGRWYFNYEKRECERFTYGGCGGNENNFENKTDCMKRCNPHSEVVEETKEKDKTIIDTAEEKDLCKLPKDAGPCRKATARWFFNHENSQCERFAYGGCDGNANNFETEMDCKTKCDSDSIVTERVTIETDVCKMSSDVGPCRTATPRWYFNFENQKCERFTYGGCDGNQNNFETEMSCLERCDPNAAVVDETKETVEVDICEQPKVIGPCRAAHPRWFFDYATGVCTRFLYGGCDGNSNNFETKDDCLRRCNPTAVVSETDVCAQPAESGMCFAYMPSWHYNSTSERCEMFVYGGCGGNDNRFESESDCLKRCSPEKLGACDSPKVVGRCRAGIPSWYYNKETVACEDFLYGGCGGNANRFETKQRCERHCVDICHFPKATGPCTSNFESWYYDTETERCQMFYYGGCGGNPNRFSSMEQCEAKCPIRSRGGEVVKLCEATTYGCCPDKTTVAEGPNKEGCCKTSSFGCCPDGLTPAVGKNNAGCDDVEEGSGDVKLCEFSDYGCCDDGVTASGPNGEDCNIVIRPNGSPCDEEKETGPCSNYTITWFFDRVSKECGRFWYGGCKGTRNRFESKEECHNTCVNPVPVEPVEPVLPVCQQPMKAGPCNDLQTKWYSNPSIGLCLEFTYGGCNGNENNFDSLESCYNACGVSVCDQPKVVGKCRAAIPRFYYNKSLGRCERFLFGGCDGNHNNFESEDSCVNTCVEGEVEVVEHTTVSDLCLLPQRRGRCRARKARWYFDSNSKQCTEFIYGGCDGNENNFLTREECKKSCAHHLATDICLLPSQVGRCRARKVRWHFDSGSGQCAEFIYGGCGGNENNFLSRAECETSCRNHITTGVIPIEPEEEIGIEKNGDIKEKCKLGPEGGLCEAYIPRFYYDYPSGDCKEFIYGGCGGNDNNFLTKNACEQECGTPTEVVINGAAVCHLGQEPGDCQDNIPSWFYNHEEGECQKFTYSGCGGNGNNFKSRRDCETACSWAAICQQPRLTGHCYASIPRFYYNPTTRECDEFIYGGCGGNANNFATFEHCTRKCAPERETERKTYDIHEDCRVPVSKGDCDEYLVRWYYDLSIDDCRRFVYTGCGGNVNKFDSRDDCRSLCIKSNAGLQPDNRSGTETEVDTTRVITTAAPVTAVVLEFDICDEKAERGTCGNWSIFWYYDKTNELCQRFYYGGCGGNANRFETEQECKKICVDRRASPTTPTTTTTTEDRRVRPSCQYSAYGCCPGSTVAAIDFFQSNCDDNVIVPDDTSDAYVVKTTANKNVSLACPGQNGQSNVGWYREGFLLSASDKRIILENMTLVLINIEKEDAGIYACRVSRGNELPFVQRYKVIILEPIELMPGPAKIEVKPGHNAFLHCHAMGNPPPRIHWKRGDYPVRSNGRHRVFPNGTLIVYMTEESDVGVYTCEARNGDSPAAHRSMELYLREQLYVKISSHEGQYQKGSTITLSCMYGGFPAPTSSWKKDGEELTSRDNIAVTDTQVVIKNAGYENTGAYSCVAKNTNEEAEAATSVQVIPVVVKEEECIDKMRRRKCKIIKAANLCGHSVFRTMCCKTCTKKAKN